MKNLRVITLFSGYGTQELALKYADINYENVANCDILSSANKVYDALHTTQVGNLGDITKIDEKTFPSCDLLTYSFPCFTKDTLVLTSYGFKTIDEVNVDDMVLTHTNTYKKVNKTFNQGKKNIWRVITPTVDEIRTTENHKFYVRNKFGVIHWKECKDLVESDYIGMAADNVLSDEQKLELYKYTIDVADVVRENKIYFKSSDKDFIYSVAQLIMGTFKYGFSIYKRSGEYHLIINREKTLTIIDNYIWTPLTRVEQTEDIEEVFDIEVDVDHSFTANGCIVHNCQDISISGVQKGIKKGTRSGLLFEVERILKHNRPKFLMMENVKNLISKNHMDAFKTYMETLEGFGYGNAWRVFNGVDFGCPQNRERVFMLSVLGETSEHVKQKLDSIQLVPRVNGHTNPMRPYIEDNVEDELFVNAPYTLNEKKEKRSVCNLIARRDDISYDQTRRIYSLDGASPCLTTSGSPQIMLDNGKFRTITAREGYRFMGVKDEDIDTILTKTNLSHRAHVALAGNSICIPVMEAIYNEFFNEYKNIDKTVLVNSDN